MKKVPNFVKRQPALAVLALLDKIDQACDQRPTMINQIDTGRSSAELMPLVEALRSMAAAGGKLPAERVLAGQLQVKRHRLRQALELLRAEGGIQAPIGRRGPLERGSEALVQGTNPLEVIELRLALEPALARLAAIRATPFDILRIDRAATTAANTDSGDADLLFHKLVAAGSRNGLAADLYSLLRQVGRDARLRVDAPAPRCPKRTARRDIEHRAIAAAIGTRNPEGAEIAMRQHLLQVQRQILEKMAPGLQVA